MLKNFAGKIGRALVRYAGNENFILRTGDYEILKTPAGNIMVVKDDGKNSMQAKFLTADVFHERLYDIVSGTIDLTDAMTKIGKFSFAVMPDCNVAMIYDCGDGIEMDKVVSIENFEAALAGLLGVGPFPSALSDVFDAYLTELVGWGDVHRWAQLPATWRWYDFWNRLNSKILEN